MPYTTAAGNGSPEFGTSRALDNSLHRGGSGRASGIRKCRMQRPPARRRTSGTARPLLFPCALGVMANLAGARLTLEPVGDPPNLAVAGDGSRPSAGTARFPLPAIGGVSSGQRARR